jgi:CRISPR-associated protein Cmr4
VKSVMLGLLAETPVHPGAGRSLGVVDLPVARENPTGYPVIVGSSLKGSLREKAEEREGRDAASVLKSFGQQEHAGDVLVSDARLLLLPVRSLDKASRFVTCPQLIERYRRDLDRGGVGPLPDVPKVESGKVLANRKGDLFLEERVFAVQGKPGKGLMEAILPLVHHDLVHERLRESLVVVNDDVFAWFARYGLSVQARNQLEDETKRSNNLWYEETLPPDTVMYSLLLGRKDDSLTLVQDMFKQDHYLQVGGNATVGQGWFAVTVREGGVE